MAAVGEVTGSKGLVQRADGAQMGKRTVEISNLKRVVTAGVKADEQHIACRHGKKGLGDR